MKRIIMALAVLTGVAAFADPVARVTKVGEEPVVYDDLRTAIAQCTKNSDKIELLSDVDLTGVAWEPMTFTGKFDGQGHTIANLSISSTTESVGFFKLIGEAANDNNEVKDLILENVSISAPGMKYVGSLVGKLYGDVSNVVVRGAIVIEGHKYVGGIIGVSYGHVLDCVVDGGNPSVSSIAKNETSQAGLEVGGIVGMVPENCDTVVGCTAKNISLYAAESDAGGIAGRSLGSAHVLGCKVENVVISAGTMVEEYTGKIVGRSVTAPNDVLKIRLFANNTATGVTIPVDQLYGSSATNLSLKTVIATDVVGDLHTHPSNYCFTAGTFLAYGAALEDIPLQVLDGYTMTTTDQRDGSYIVHLAPTSESSAMANVYLDYNYQQVTLSGAERFDIVKAGDTVSFTVAAKSGYKVGSVSFNGVNATGVDGVYSYTVTADDVDATVEGGARGVTVKVQAAALADVVVLTIPNIEGLGKPLVTYVDGDGVTQTPEVTKNSTGDWEVTVPRGAEITITYPNPVEGKKADPEETTLTVKDEDGDGKESVDEDKLPKAVNASEEGTPVMISAIELIEDGSALKTRLTVENLIAGGVYYYRASTDLLTLKSATSVKITEAPTADKLIFSVDRSASDTKCFYEVLVK